MVNVRMDSEWHLVQLSCSSRAYLDPALQGSVQVVFEYLEEWRVQNFTEQPLSLLDPLKIKMLFCSGGTSCVLLCTSCLWSCSWVLQKGVCLCLLWTFSLGIYTLIRLPLRLLFWLNSPRTLSLSSHLCLYVLVAKYSHVNQASTYMKKLLLTS